MYLFHLGSLAGIICDNPIWLNIHGPWQRPSNTGVKSGAYFTMSFRHLVQQSISISPGSHHGHLRRRRRCQLVDGVCSPSLPVAVHGEDALDLSQAFEQSAKVE